ncbi:F-actin-capping protein subunit beta isoforms 1 and 2 [Thelohanellus kitauei]|uniref:F-actin-capping protein subunit beta n=1 Tax=Thelohanellus kitauei TaxID=669202 RepID=A0A0C2M792_THEKT|nr:F-actin-capping protein subunit beta isoforms 1 and 2 [Thelohanellus kitauei]
MDENSAIDSCLDLMRRLPPENIEKNLSAILDLTPPDMIQNILSAVDQPLKVAVCKTTKKQYLICDYNRDGDSYRLFDCNNRSPWSNDYDPPISDGVVPSEKLRALEIKLNTAFDQYRELYFDGGISSCFLWDLEDSSFAGVLLIKKGEGSEKVKGCWDSIHVFEVIPGKQQNVKYKLTSTVMLWLQTNKFSGKLQLGGSLTRQSESTGTVKEFDDHLIYIGQAVEEMESKIRQTLSSIYFSKTKDILNSLRSMTTVSDELTKKKLQEDLASRIKQR